MKNKLDNIFTSSGCPNDGVLQKYLNGELSHQQKHKIEEHLINCEMCSDELEGLLIINNTKELDIVVERINNKINDKLKSQKTKFIYTYGKIAAALLILISIGSLFILFNHYKNTDTKKTLAENIQPVQSEIQKKESLQENKNDTSSIINKNNSTSQYKLKSVKTEEQQINTQKEEANKSAVSGLVNIKSNVDSLYLAYSNTIEEESLNFNDKKAEQIPENIIKKSNKKENYGSITGAMSDKTENKVSRKKEKNKYKNAPATSQNLFSSKEEISPNNDDLLKTALDYYSTGKYSEAKKKFEQIFKNQDFTDYQKAQWYYALTLIKLNEISKAKKLLKEISKTPNHKYLKKAKKKLLEIKK